MHLQDNEVSIKNANEKEPVTASSHEVRHLFAFSTC